MKKIFAALLISIFTVGAMAAVDGDSARPGHGRPGRGGGWNPPPSHGGGWNPPGHGGGWGGRPVVTCSASDRGWEEHFGGHSDCNSCVRKHGQCVETCSTESFRSVAEGIDYRGYKMSVEARGSNRYQTEREAYDRCSRMYRYSNCRIVNSTTDREIVSRRSCR